ncbi:MAG: endonuclease/exonuclease/phosphatase family protein [Bacteroidales bacterium]|nr:endonuclease/exonuclease/phosphatase family protein [Bacteroidales bacterium]
MGAKAIKLYFRGIVLLVTIGCLILSILITRAGITSPQDKLWLQYASTLSHLLIIFNIGLIFYWVFHKKVWALIPLLAIIINYQQLTSVVGIRFNEKATNSESSFTVCSFNVNYFNHNKAIRAPEISALINENQVEILALQEFNAISYYNLNELIGEFDFMDYRAVYGKEKGSIGMAIFSQYPIINSSKIKFNNSSNGFMWADLLIDGDTVRVINTHLQTTGFYSSYNKGVKYIYRKAGENFILRAAQAKTVRSFIDSTPYPIIVCGDFNDTPYGYVYNTIRGKDLQDSFLEKGVGLGGTYRRTLNLLRIDLILVSNHFKVKSHKVTSPKLSDHKPIFSELEYQN